MAVFLDTSALAKLYHLEVGSDVVDRMRAQSGGGFISRLGLVEMHSVLALKVRTGHIEPVEAEILGRDFRADIARGRFRVGAVFSSANTAQRKACVRWIHFNWPALWKCTRTGSSSQS